MNKSLFLSASDLITKIQKFKMFYNFGPSRDCCMHINRSKVHCQGIACTTSFCMALYQPKAKT